MRKVLQVLLCALSLAAVTGPVAAAAQAPATAYVVRAGDTMYGIAGRHGIRLAELIRANPQVKNPAAITPGLRLAIPGKAIDWMAPSGGAYPVIKSGDKVWIDADLSDQRISIKKGSQTLYTMVTSAGTEPDHPTPRGTFTVERERGDWFYSQKYQEGAKYWTSWKGHGIYLFHSVVMDKNQRVIETEARKLGAAASHGCFRLTVADARWIYEQIPTGTKVVVHP
jgi:lipoprotein-anchoring transpeptidase ErfK/SrfK